MIRGISLLAMAAGFLIISASLRRSALSILGRAMLALDKFSPYSYIALALALGAGVILSVSSTKPR
jgi:hypothetical protein